MKKCVNCGNEFKKLYEDAARPPIDEGECLCVSCWEETAQNQIDELMSERSAIAEQADKIGAELELYT